VFNINAWLEREGYLVTNAPGSSTVSALASSGVNVESLTRILGKVGLRETASKLAPGWLVSRLPDTPSGSQTSDKADLIDWEQTTAVASGQGPVYTADSIDTDVLVSRLRSLCDDDGRPVVDEVHRVEQYYPEADDTPDTPTLLVEQRKGVHTTDALGSGRVFQTAAERNKWRAENHKEGLLLAAGPDIRNGWKQDRIGICQIAPGVLHLLGLDVPADMTAEQLDLRADGTVPTRRQSLRLDTNRRGSDDETMEDRLRDLGYLE